MSKSTSITDRAMLAKLSISTWSGRAMSSEASEVVAQHYGSNSNFTRVVKALVDPSVLDGVQSAAAAARKLFYESTTPWADEGRRALLSMRFSVFDQGISRHRAEFEAARDEFLRNYDQHVAAAQASLGTLFVQGEYPDANEIAEKFRFEITYDPITNPHDWRVGLSEETITRLVAEAEQRQMDLITRAQADAVSRAHKAVTAMAEKLVAYDPDAEGAAKNAFRASLVSNVAEMAAALPGLNIAGDPAIDALAAEMAERLTVVPPEVLRTSTTARDDVATAAAEIAEKMKGFL
jgi:hypothetical protein